MFRLKRDASARVGDFFAGGTRDELVKEGPTSTAAERPPCRLRLAKYVIRDKVYVLGTTLLDAGCYPAADLADLCHGRWSVEELYKGWSDCPIPQFRSRALANLSSRAPIRWMGAEDPVQPETARGPALAAG